MTKTLKGTEVEIIRHPGGAATHRYDVTLKVGHWPSDRELVNLCDADNFGGAVTKLSQVKAQVRVYVD